jgi:murein DD-endopeptidase MepM/ murein hydrolase activator NlpD
MHRRASDRTPKVRWGARSRIVAAGVGLAAVGVTTGANGALASAALTVRITSAPPSASPSPAATFGWVANETAQFACSLDGARAAACSSPKTYSGLAEGVHLFLVTATNTDRAGRTYTARDTHRWTIDLSGVPPPPPPPQPPRTATLLVGVEGSGEVSSEPAGIACPGDCEQSFPVGTKVTLTRKALPGSGFAGWHGACDGQGACTPTISATKAVEAVFNALGLEPHPYRGDRDRDGLSDARDACPHSSTGLRALLAGCTAADLLNGADGPLDDVDDALATARRGTLGTKGLKVVGRDLSAVMDLIEYGSIDFSDGNPCGGAATIGKGARLMKSTVAKSQKLIDAMQKGIAKQPEPGGAGDADQKELQLAGLHYRQGLIGQAGGQVAKLGKAYAAVCGALGGKVELVGRVGKTNDVEGSLQLDDGRIVSLAGADFEAGDIWEGGRVKIVAQRVGRGPFLAHSIIALDKPLPKLAVKPCISMLVAPVQDFFKADPILHSPIGYSFNKVLRLETGMRVAASSKCAQAKGGRYSLLIVMSSSKNAFTVAPDLDPQDSPVALQVGGSATLWSITVYERYQGGNCAPPGPSKLIRVPASAAKSFPCPVQTLSTTVFKARVLDAGAYGRAVYEKTVFPLESSAPQTAKAEVIYPLHYTIESSKATLEGEGYKPGGSPGPLATIKLNEPFALWPDEYYGAPLLFPLDTIGVDHFAGLLWPRIVGTRSGKPFRYVAELPTLVKDMLPGCPSATCYRLPWKFGTGVTTTQGNGPGFSHNGKQLYAYDFGMGEGATIYATRGGVVGDLVESNWKNFNPCADNNGNGVKGDDEDKKADGPANFVRIDHDDGTYSYYAHVQQNSVIPAKGAPVQRGDPIASVGNVGRSCGPHLHYQVSTDKTDTIYGQTTPICFEGWLLTLSVNFDFYHCYKPVKNDLMFSNNG